MGDVLMMSNTSQTIDKQRKVMFSNPITHPIIKSIENP